jgi:hypothetical protein
MRSVDPRVCSAEMARRGSVTLRIDPELTRRPGYSSVSVVHRVRVAVIRLGTRRARSGNRGTDRINHHVRNAEPIKLEPPHHVIKEARKEWYRIVPMLDKMGVLGNVDTAAWERGGARKTRERVCQSLTES